ncbi:response regulator transcription factor [Nesterenkonia xinjiangensis]|uniref:DNA-binding NarL/FixJ family response regulator n=1 Tax=Nesterenkonia xinjiangensis TaxID=225327 RepID=A0A7Z0KCG5_9MICC|nr:response regulator transcription factor [Nesterenkonia xinjiangensis]NYJ78592.1 DNA-binding NarL/FixJ family response regulator [Nesterenkonia xinjiangensis]
MISVLIADDQVLVRTGLRALLTHDPEITVVAESRTGQDAVRAVQAHRPDVVLMDIRMPVMDGIEATRRICADPELDGSRILILTTFDEDQDIIDAVRAGAAGYLLKDIASEELRTAVRTAAAGGNLLSPTIARKVMEHMASAPSPQDETSVDLSELTDREIEVLTRVGHGDTNAEIGAALFLSPATARTYVSRILAKLQARDRTELAIIAHRAGLPRTNR